MKKFVACAALGLLSLTATTLTSAEMDVEDAIYYRQAGYGFMSWNMGKIKAQTIDESVPFNKDQMIAAANVIAAVANSGMGALYPAGSDKGDTKLKPEFFQNMDEVGKIARNFNLAANELAKVAQTGDKAAIANAFGEVGKTCKACHEKFRAK